LVIFSLLAVALVAAVGALLSLHPWAGAMTGTRIFTDFR